MRVSVTQLKINLGQYLESSVKEPVFVEKSGRKCAVLVSFETFEKLSRYEDLYWASLAVQAESEGYLRTEKTASKLEKYAKRAGVKNATAIHNKEGR